MQKYLLLLLMCLVGTMGVQAKITVVPPEESETGAYELTFSEGEAGEGEYANIAALPDYVKNAKSLVMKSSDYELSRTEMELIMGGTESTLFPYLEELDMGDAELFEYSDLALMSNATSTKGLTHLKYFVFPKNTDVIPNNPKGMFEDNTVIEEVIMLERDDTNKSGFTVISANTFKNASNLTMVRIPDGITTIGPSAFGGEQQDVNGSTVLTGPKMEAISFPNSLLYIQANAFDNCPGLKSVTIPASVKEIQKFAFQNNVSMEDVYIIGNDVKIGFSAFDNIMTYDNFYYESTKDGDADVVSVWDWKKYSNAAQGYIHPLRLHFANNETARSHYMNIALQLLNDPDLTDEVLDLITSTNGNVYYDQNAPNHQDVKDLIDGLLQKYQLTLDHGFSIQYLIEDKGWVYMDNHRYYTNPDGKFMGESTENDDVNYGGWHNFMFAAADLGEKTWPDDRMIDSRWYSAVFPFNMSYNQLIAAYGNGTDVREFSYVNEYEENGKTVRTVTFNKVITGPRLGRGNRVDRDAPDYIKKGYPYMIHPGVRSIPVEVNGDTIYRTIAGVDVSEATATVNNNTDLKEVPGNLIRNGNTSDVIASKAYYFKGTYQKSTIPANTFYLGYDPEHGYPLAFYVTRKDLPNKWTEFTSIVRKTNDSGTSTAKVMGIDFSVIFAEEELGITTKIESTKNDRVESQKVYNLSGQVVRENNGSLQGLSKGVYVVNGKKVVVR